MKHPLSYVPLALGFLVLALSLPLAAWKITQPTPARTFRTQAAATSSTVGFLPEAGNFSLRQKTGIAVGIILDSGEKKIKAVDLKVSYDPALVNVVELNKGLLLDDYLTVANDAANGEMAISGLNNSERQTTGILASFKFLPKAAGPVTFNFTQANGVDRGIAATYTIE